MDFTKAKTFADIVNQFVGFLNSLIPLIFALTLLFIVWKVVDAWIINGGDQNKIEEGKKTVLVGVIALVVMSGIWGIIAILQKSLF